MKFRIAVERVFRIIFWHLTGHRFYGAFNKGEKGKDGLTYVPVWERYYEPVQPKE